MTTARQVPFRAGRPPGAAAAAATAGITFSGNHVPHGPAISPFQPDLAEQRRT